MNKYNFTLDTNSRNSLSIILNRLKKDSIVLEVGTANGRMTKYMKEVLNCKIYGIEIDEHSAKDAEIYCEKMLVDSVENYTWVEKYKDIKFDYILFTDVLEHLYQPEKVLLKVKKFLKDDGSIFMSIPNIAHNSILIELLKDKFTYSSIGLLDNTHIRFFTKHSIDDLLKKSNLDIAYETAVYHSPEKTEFGYHYNDVDNDFGSVLANREYGEVYQFIIEAKKTCRNPIIDFQKREQSILFLDTGNGFNQKEVETTFFTQHTNSNISFNLNNPINNVSAIRIDPIEDTLLLKIEKVLVNGIEVNKNISFNGTLNKKNEISFLTTDPNITIQFEVPLEIKSVVLFYKKLIKSFSIKDQKIQEKNKEIQEKDKEIQEKDKEIQEKDKEIQEKDKEIQRLYLLTQSMRIKNRMKRILGVSKVIEKIKNIYNYKRLQLSKTFDENYYIQNYPDIQDSELTPFEHYYYYGWKEGKNPSQDFNTKDYLVLHSNLRELEVNPLLHFVLYGAKDSLRTNAMQAKKLGNFERIIYLLKDLKKQPYLIDKFIFEVKKHGMKHAIKKIKFFLLKNYKNLNLIMPENENISTMTQLEIIPYYIDTSRDKKISDFNSNISLAIHFHIDNIENFTKAFSLLKFIQEFDLYISVPDYLQDQVQNLNIRSKLSNIKKLIIRSVPNEINGITALIIEFGKKLLMYEYIGHFNASDHKTLELFLDQTGITNNNILSLLQSDAKIIYTKRETHSIKDPSGWYNNFVYSKSFLSEYSHINLDNFTKIDFPETGMFLAQTKCLSEFLLLPLTYKKYFSKNEKLEKTLKQLLLIFTDSYNGRIYCIHAGNSITDYCYYEEQNDYSSSITHNNIKILTYYLGQFHPIPENDEWHGKGFTEWTNVKSAYPLFEGHYQQHIPHKDIGYYLLDNPEILNKQEQMMKKAGVYGQIFYHYWFSGKLILEKPVQMLLENKDIDMPFCFCWANENWTKRWDGNDEEVLLGQIYSKEDAKSFIQYLIPFFQDSRYIKINNHPVLYIYRPSSIPDTKEYIDIWKEECAKVSIEPPYIVAVLTRGTTTPKEHHMDAGVERILHDWTDGAVPELKNTLNQYHDITGTVLSYNHVADFYEKQTDTKDFTYFRSISPMWDNTARYDEGAYALHGSSPKRFQSWISKLISYTHKTLKEEEQFIIVNAWNEWAEGAHLEPDTYNGYSYLNSIGRALSDIPYSASINVTSNMPKTIHISIQLTPNVQRELATCKTLKKQFLYSLNNSTIFEKDNSIISDCQVLIDEIDTIEKQENIIPDLTISIQTISLFNASVLEKLLHSAHAYPNSKIIPNTYASETIYKPSENGSVDANLLYNSPIIVTADTNNKNVRLRTDSKCFPTKSSHENNLPEVTTIIRFHKSANLDELENALFSLATMEDVIVKPLIAAQDLDEEMKDKLVSLTKKIPFKQNEEIAIVYYESDDGQGDLRSTMLNESLFGITTRFAAILDYDDLLFPEAYSYLIKQIEDTGKAISFGRVYETLYNKEIDLIIQRNNTFEYGYSYDDFFRDNHAPIHSFMLDLEKLDISHLSYHKDHLYMEDYYLTLQLFTSDNANWDSLKNNIYLGDYIHSTNRDHTLALTCDIERNNLLSDPIYQRDDKRISAMKNKLHKKI